MEVTDDDRPQEPAAGGRAGRLIERWVPGASVPAGPRRRRVVVFAALVAVAAMVAVTVVVTGPDRGVAQGIPPGLQQVGAPPPVHSGQRGGSIVVSVVGKVTAPGLVTVAEGARVADVIRAAGGASSGVNLGGLNLARRVTDGEQIYVGVPAPPDAQAGPQPDAPAPPGGKIDLNTASPSQLDTLPGVGQVTAQRIVEWRTKHGRFASVDQLREIDGIGATRFGRLRELVAVR